MRSAVSDRTRKPGVYSTQRYPDKEEQRYRRKSNGGISSNWRRRQDTNLRVKSRSLAPVAAHFCLLLSPLFRFARWSRREGLGLKSPILILGRHLPKTRWISVPRRTSDDEVADPPSASDSKEHSTASSSPRYVISTFVFPLPAYL